MTPGIPKPPIYKLLSLLDIRTKERSVQNWRLAGPSIYVSNAYGVQVTDDFVLTIF